MRASRLLQLLLLLQARGRMSAPRLAAELEVSLRTVYRDLEALSAAGVPVYSEPGRNGGARLVDGWRTRLTGLTHTEAEALPLLGLPGAAAELGLGTVLAATQLKVQAALPPELRGRVSRVSERFHLDAPGWFHREEQLPHLHTVAEAVWSDGRIRLRYSRPDREVERTVDPLGLVLKAGTWYLVAAHRGQPRTYRVSRITAVEHLDARFDRPDDFDLAVEWAASSGAFEQTMYRLTVRARVREDRMRSLEREIDPVAARQIVRADGQDGWAVVTFPGETVDVCSSQLLAMGDAVEVLEPAELRRRMVDEVTRMAHRYGVTATAGRRRRPPTTARAGRGG